MNDFANLNPRASWEAVNSMLEPETLLDFTTGLVDATVPILLFACGQDKLSSVGSMRKIFSQVHRGRMVTVHRSGHFPMLESPQKFANLLKEFLSEGV